jgi:hypothetical protein
MDERKVSTLENFWRMGRSAADAAWALQLPLEEVQRFYDALNARRQVVLKEIKRLRARVASLLVLLSLSLCASGAMAQTVSPVITELASKGTKPVTGSFTITNPGLVSITAVVEQPQSMTFTNGKPLFQPLDSGTTLELSQQSARIGARQSAQFWYKLTCRTKPCALTVYATITGAHVSNGMAIAIHLPHIIYVCEKQKNCRANIIKGEKP